MNQQENFCRESIQRLESQLISFTRKLRLVGTIRVTWFLTFLVVFVYFINVRQLDWAIFTFVVFIGGFGSLVILFNRLKFSQDQHKFLIEINQQELNRLENDFTDLPDGAEFMDSHHAYAVDLDIFGPNSIYQLLNRTATIPGAALLAARLQGDPFPGEPLAYQESVQEISQHPEFIQEYQALGMHFDLNKEEYDDFNAWLTSDQRLDIVEKRNFLLLALPALFLLGFIVTTVFSISYYALLPIIAVNLYLLGVNHAKTSKVVEQTSAVVKLLKTYLHHLRLIREIDFKASFTRHLQGILTQEEHSAELEISHLSKLLDHLQGRNNLLHIFINIPLLLDLQWMMRLNKWKAVNKEALDNWLTTLAEFEVLVSLAGTSFMNPEWSFPKLTEEVYILHGSSFCHPLIKADKRICNDFTLRGSAQSVIVTGPNMAGKSTFLRTMALNVVLARMGGAACAREMIVSKDLRVFTAMRTQDNLSENISSFYAELDRIKQLLELINSGQRVLYFLDELLKGTNSADRHRGAEALVKQLINLNVSGFVSTHDIELGELTQQLPGVSNFSFESIITEGQISFDYKIREGVCSSFNASELMRQMGIKL